MQTVSRIAAIIRAVATQPNGMSLAELSRTTRLSPAACHRLIEALELEGFVERDPESRRFRLGLGIVRLAATIAPVGGFGPQVESTLSALRDTWDETVFLGVLVDGDVVLVSSNPPGDERVLRPLGHRVPLHASAAGKAILAHLPEEQALELLSRAPLERLTRFTRCDVAEVLDELAAARSHGFAVCDEETDLGIVAYAAPVASPPGEPPRCLGVIGSRTRMLAHLRGGLLDSLMSAAESLSDSALVAS